VISTKISPISVRSLAPSPRKHAYKTPSVPHSPLSKP
jgi:hypothetical protein